MALLEPDLRERVRKRLNRRGIQAGKPLYGQGDPPDALYLVDSGRFRISMRDERGLNERVLRFVGPGDILGEAAFMGETPHVSSAVAVEDARVWRLSRADFDALLGNHEHVLRYMATIISERQAQANARLAADAASDESRGLHGYVTALYSPRGGAGVTTLAVTLAIGLAERHPDDVALLDLDVLFGHAHSNMWLEAKGSLSQVAPTTMPALDRAGLDHYLRPHPSSLRVMAAATRPEDGQNVTGDHVRGALHALRRHFGFVVLDLPHGFSEVTLAGLEQADRVLVVATPERTTLTDIAECRRIFAEVLNMPSDRVSYVLNHPLPYSAVPTSEFTTATATPWVEVPFGGEGPSMAALRGESMLRTRPNNPVTRAALRLAEVIGTEAGELAALQGRST